MFYLDIHTYLIENLHDVYGAWAMGIVFSVLVIPYLSYLVVYPVHVTSQRPTLTSIVDQNDGDHHEELISGKGMRTASFQFSASGAE